MSSSNRNCTDAPNTKPKRINTHKRATITAISFTGWRARNNLLFNKVLGWIWGGVSRLHTRLRPKTSAPSQDRNELKRWCANVYAFKLPWLLWITGRTVICRPLKIKTIKRLYLIQNSPAVYQNRRERISPFLARPALWLPPTFTIDFWVLSHTKPLIRSDPVRN